MFRSLILALGLATTTPVLADSLSVTLSPRSAQQAQALQLALGLYALNREIRGGATVQQLGQGNAAAILQARPGNWALIDQRGQGHQGTIAQSGTGNMGALFQSGRNTTAAIRQQGGQTGVTIVHGW